MGQVFNLRAGFLMMGLPIAAHHSFAAKYDSTKKIELKGVVTKFEWTNPHAHFYIDVTDKQIGAADDRRDGATGCVP